MSYIRRPYRSGPSRVRIVDRDEARGAAAERDLIVRTGLPVDKRGASNSRAELDHVRNRRPSVLAVETIRAAGARARARAAVRGTVIGGAERVRTEYGWRAERVREVEDGRKRVRVVRGRRHDGQTNAIVPLAVVRGDEDGGRGGLHALYLS
jgi:hypothetical protein